MNRFARTEQLLGKDACVKLSRARVAVFGMGGVGSYAVEAIARAGVGHMLLADFDIVKATNINRQLFALHSTLLKPKVMVAKERVADINPECDVEVIKDFVNAHNLEEILDYSPDVVVDAVDSVTPKTNLIHASYKRGIYIVSSMGAAGRTDPALIRCGDLSETTVCPLARILRKRLHRRGIYSGVRCVYSIEEPKNRLPFEESGEDDSLDTGRKRVPIGSISYLPGIFGLLAAGEVVSYLVDLPKDRKNTYKV